MINWIRSYLEIVFLSGHQWECRVGEPGGGSGVRVHDVCASPGAGHTWHRCVKMSDAAVGPSLLYC